MGQWRQRCIIGAREGHEEGERGAREVHEKYTRGALDGHERGTRGVSLNLPATANNALTLMHKIKYFPNLLPKPMRETILNKYNAPAHTKPAFKKYTSNSSEHSCVKYSIAHAKTTYCPLAEL